MNALKKALFGIGAGLGLTALFSTQSLAQTNDKIALNTTKPKTETTKETKFIYEGHAGDAQGYSIANNALVVLISGGAKNEKYTAEQYSTMLHKMFKDPARTNYPIDVVFYINESGLDRNTYASVFINGREVDWNGGKLESKMDALIHPTKLVAQIGFVTSEHAKKNGLASLNSSDASPSLAQN